MQNRPLFLAHLFVATLAAASTGASAAEFVWDGGSPLTSNWSAAANWLGDVVPDSNGTADVVFAGTESLLPVADFDWNIRSVRFAPGAASFDISGSTLTLGAGGILHQDDSVHTIRNDLILNANQAFTTTSTGSLSIFGRINTNGRSLNAVAASDFIALRGAIFGPGSLVLSGPQAVVLAGDESNTYTGGTTILGPVVLAKTSGATAIPGAVTIGNPSAFGAISIGFDEQIANDAAVTVRAGAIFSLNTSVVETVGSLNIEAGSVQVFGGTLNVGPVSLAGGTIATGTGKLALNGPLSATSNGAQGAVISGNLNLGGAARTIDISDDLAAVELEIQAAIANGSLVKTGAGALRIAGVQNYGSLTARAGLVEMETQLGSGAASVNVTPLSGTARVNFESSQRLAGLTIGNGGVVVLVNEDSIAGPPELSGTAFAPLAVPEPTSLGLLAAASIALMRAGGGCRKTGRGERI